MIKLLRCSPSRPLAVVAFLIAAAPLTAQERVDGRTVYAATFFETFAPATALQIVQRVPGFRLEDIDQDVRGFGQAAGNVVINGERPSAKSDSLSTILARIPAGRVARVEVGPGDGFGAEFAGRPQVVNLVLTEGSGIAGTVQARLRHPYAGKLRADGKASWLVKRGRSSFTIAVDYNNDSITDYGTDTLSSLPSGALIEQREKYNRRHDPEGDISFGWAHDDGPDRRANLNIRYARGHFALSQDNMVSIPGQPARLDDLRQLSWHEGHEIGADLSRPLGSGTLKLIGLTTRTLRDYEDLSLIGIGTPASSAFHQTQRRDARESVGRLVWSRPSTSGWSVEFGGEVALNRLESMVALSIIAPDGSLNPVDLPLANAVVRELRFEPFINTGRNLAPGLRADFALTLERSRLTVTGDTDAVRTLAFLKPRASIDWRTGGWQIQARAERSVNQLDFGDFISAADLASDRVNGSSADLVPQQAWEFLFSAERPLLGTGIIRAELGINFVQQVQDRVPIADGLDAPGNLGSGIMRIARLNLDAPLDRFGIAGARATMRLSVVDTSVEDPYTLRDRPFSGKILYLLDIGFRQDLGQFAWGIDAYINPGSTQYRRNELDRNYRQNPYAEAFAEWRPDSRTSLTLRAENMFNVQFYRERLFFQPDRSVSAPEVREYRVREQHITPSLTFKRSFG